MKLTGLSGGGIIFALKNDYPELPGVMSTIDSRIKRNTRAIEVYQAYALYALAKRFNRPGARVLEIGTAIGYSAAVLASALPDAQIITLNPHAAEAAKARANLSAWGNVQVVESLSWDYLETYAGEPFDLIFVDGDHKRVRRDFAWWDHLRDGGLFLFHDYSPAGTYRACVPVYEALNELRDELKRDFDVLIVDDGGVGIAGFVRGRADLINADDRRLATAHLYSSATYSYLYELFRIGRGFAAQPGALVECGCQNGGSAGALLLGLGERPAYLFDTFAGCPRPIVACDGDKAFQKWNSQKAGWALGGISSVAQMIASLEFDAAHIHIVPGAFADTLAITPTEPVAVLHVDATLYDSTKLALERFYDDVVPGGAIIVSAYHHWQGIRQAFDEFCRARKIMPSLRTLEKAVWWVK